mmetsp:Transcript_4608/g.12854  ORF Transcript_4608/g.12854 Transcript_4608/m.12854 type:complete len:267 (+) Transcript_4608:1258-2058(+)
MTTTPELSVLLVDVDFVPSRNLHATLHSTNAAQRMLRKDAPEEEDCGIVVVPAFETSKQSSTSSSTKNDLPRSISELQPLVDDGLAQGFHLDQYPQGHAATEFDRYWELSTTDLSPEKIWESAYSIQHNEGFEPYVVMSAKNVPLYDERFQGYGLNKVSHLATVAAQVSSTFWVLPGVFLVSSWHAPSQDRRLIYGNDDDDDVSGKKQATSQRQQQERQEELRALYNDFRSSILPGGALPVVSPRTNARYRSLRRTLWEQADDKET